MSVVVFAEIAEGKVKKTSLEAVSYAAALNSGDVVAVVLGTDAADSELGVLGTSGATKVVKVADERLNQGVIMAYSSALAQVAEQQGADTLVLAKSSLGDPVAARVAIKLDAALIGNVTELPTDGQYKRSIYTGKAFATTALKKDKKIIAIKKNAIGIKEDGAAAAIEQASVELTDADFAAKITSQDKKTGEILLPEADLVVSGGRGLKGPENWGMLEDLATEMGAATGCSKPVSDMDWRPHHEHVGQTGVKVAPSLYIAVGISGAIQHLAGVNSSKCIVVINKDEEAPFFKAADYGIVGDAFDVVPKLLEAVKASN